MIYLVAYLDENQTKIIGIAKFKNFRQLMLRYPAFNYNDMRKSNKYNKTSRKKQFFKIIKNINED